MSVNHPPFPLAHMHAVRVWILYGKSRRLLYILVPLMAGGDLTFSPFLNLLTALFSRNYRLVSIYRAVLMTWKLV
jgi:hypothetical protein